MFVKVVMVTFNNDGKLKWAFFLLTAILKHIHDLLLLESV